MKLSGKKILVTGSDGFIGSHLTEELVRRGYDVRAFVYYNSFNSWGWLDHCPPEIKKSLDVVAGDVRDPFGVKQAMEGCDVVMHLAALIAIPYSYRSPAAYVDTNVMGSLNIVAAARELGVEKVVHASTSETYGTARYVPIDEDHPLQGQSPYSASKIGGTRSRSHSTSLSGRLSRSRGRSTPTAPASPRERSFRPSSPRSPAECARSSSASIPSLSGMVSLLSILSLSKERSPFDHRAHTRGCWLLRKASRSRAEAD